MRISNKINSACDHFDFEVKGSHLKKYGFAIWVASLRIIALY